MLAAEERNFSDEDDQSSKRCQNLRGMTQFSDFSLSEKRLEIFL